MSIDTSHISLSSLITTPLKKSGKFLIGPCPFCGGKDRFLVKDDSAWFCRHCNPTYSDVIAFIQKRDLCTFFEACQTLRLETDKPQPRRAPAPRPNMQIASLDEDKAILSNPDYQVSALDFVFNCNQALAAEENRRAREYLIKRGINPRLSSSRLLGFNAVNHNAVWGGVSVWLPRGIIIPHWQNNQTALWRVNIRRATGEPKYIQPAGCSTHGLYSVGYLRAGVTVVLCEGEFDALCLKSQLLGRADYDRVVAIATGSAGASRVLRNVAKLAAVRRVLVAFDDDQAGDDGAKWWLAALGENASRARPYEHDITDMFLAGNLSHWIDKYL